jgi:hypothetical protein
MKRRDFLKGIGAALAGLFVSRQEPEADPLEPYDPGRQYVVPRLRDCPGETVTDVDWEICPNCGGQYWTAGDDEGLRCSSCGTPPKLLEHYEAALDACECAPMEFTVYYGECDARPELEMHFTVVAESIECLPNGGTVYNNFRLKDSAGETA